MGRGAARGLMRRLRLSPLAMAAAVVTLVWCTWPSAPDLPGGASAVLSAGAPAPKAAQPPAGPLREDRELQRGPDATTVETTISCANETEKAPAACTVRNICWIPQQAADCGPANCFVALGSHALAGLEMTAPVVIGHFDNGLFFKLSRGELQAPRNAIWHSEVAFLWAVMSRKLYYHFFYNDLGMLYGLLQRYTTATPTMSLQDRMAAIRDNHIVQLIVRPADGEADFTGAFSQHPVVLLNRTANAPPQCFRELVVTGGRSYYARGGRDALFRALIRGYFGLPLESSPEFTPRGSLVVRVAIAQRPSTGTRHLVR